ncbi:MAG: NAD-binding protein, partial [Campylobacterota bacterium]|nr:NAD-binding protein [Campylobacterota bacterium]
MDKSISKDKLNQYKVKNIFKAMMKHDSYIVNIIAIIGVILATWGFVVSHKITGIDYNLYNSIYSTIRLFAFDLDAPDLKADLIWQLEVSRWMIAFFMFYYIAKGIILIAKTKYELFKLSIFGGGHVIICGCGEKGRTLGEDWLKKYPNTKLFYIESDLLNSNIETLQELGAIVIHGKAQEELILKKLKVNKASHFIATTNDTTNMEIISTLTKVLKNKEYKRFTHLKCFVHLQHSEFYDFFMATRFNADDNMLDIKVFNIYSNSARMLFNDKINNRILGDNVFKDKTSIVDKKSQVKVAIFGFGKLGENILLQALHLGHFYNETPIKVTVVYDQDRDINKNIEDEFNKQYDVLKEQHNGKYWDVEIIDDGDFLKDENGKEKKMDYTQLIVAYEDEFDALSNLMKLLKRYNDEILTNNIDVSIYSNSFENTAQIIHEDKNNKKDTVFKKVRTFGMLKETCSYDMVIDQTLDKKAVLNNNHYNELHGYNKENKTAQEQWKELDILTKDSNRYLMDHNEIKKSLIEKFIKESTMTYDYKSTRDNIEHKYFYDHQNINWDDMGLENHSYSTKLSVDEIVTLAKAEHNRWNAFHILNGWKKMSV